MAEEVKPDVIKKTQTALNKYIKKPPLTERLLKKPPFRFLHDIVTSVIKETGFLEGVFTPDELVADNVKDRDSKVKFLTKLINAVKQATGNPIKAKPNKIVAGLEVDKTHELLQALAKGISVKSNGKKAAPITKDPKKSKSVEEKDNKNEKKDVKEKAKLKDGSPSNSFEKQPSVEDGAEKRRGSAVEEERKRSRERSSARRKENGEVEEKGKLRAGSGKVKENGVSEVEGVKENGVAVEEGKVEEERRREGSAARGKENGEVVEEGKGDVERRSGRRRESSAARGKENGETEEGKGDGERRSGRRRESSAARSKENGEVVEEGKGDGERRSGRRRESSAARGKENGEVAEEGKGDIERRSGRRRESSAARSKENGEEGKGDGERRSGRRRESITTSGKENGEVEEGKGNSERRSGRRRNSSAGRSKENGEEGKGDGERRRERSSTGGRETEEANQERLANGFPEEGPEPARGRRGSGLRKAASGDGSGDLQDGEETAETAARRPQTRRASSRSSRGPLKAFGEKDGKSVELKEEEEEPKGKPGPSTLGGGAEAGPPLRPPSSLERPRTARRAPPSGRPGSGRPPSARPARPPSAVPGAPRVRDRGEVQQDIKKDEGDKEIKEVVVITENDKAEDKEGMVVVENPSLQLAEAEKIGEDASPALEGVLVDSILESQSELEKRKSGKAQRDIEWEAGKARRGASWEKECGRLREGVQGLTRSAGPLGKLFDFLQEDVDLASRELAVWRRASATFAHQLATEQRLSEDTLSRPRKKLEELEAQIEEQHEAIRALKSSILGNERKIQSHLSRFPVR